MEVKDDLISRQDAIDELHKCQTYLFDSKDHDMKISLEDAEYAIQILPSAEPQWIPVSERLPRIDMSYPHSEPYLVVYDGGSMDVARWSNFNRFWVDHVTEPYWCKAQYCEVIAWMPLPDPYETEADHE